MKHVSAFHDFNVRKYQLSLGIPSVVPEVQSKRAKVETPVERLAVEIGDSEEKYTEEVSFQGPGDV